MQPAPPLPHPVLRPHGERGPREPRLPDVGMAQWTTLVARRARGVAVRRVLDLGCGIGSFSPRLAGTLRAPVVAVDRSELMLDFAREENPDPRVRYVRGDAGRLPLAAGTIDVAWLSMVVPCLDDLAAAARELARVVAPGGVVLVRSLFRERLAEQLVYAFFPSALAPDEERLPTARAVRAAFESGGLAFARADAVVQVVDPDLAAHAERMRLRASPCFDAVPDEEYEIGLLAMDAVAAADALPGPVTETVDLLAFVRPR